MSCKASEWSPLSRSFTRLSVRTLSLGDSTKPQDRPLKVNECFSAVFWSKWIQQALFDSSVTWINLDVIASLKCKLSLEWKLIKEPLTTRVTFAESNTDRRNKSRKCFLESLKSLKASGLFRLCFEAPGLPQMVVNLMEHEADYAMWNWIMLLCLMSLKIHSRLKPG